MFWPFVTSCLLVGMAGLIALPFLCHYLHWSSWWELVPAVIFLCGAIPLILFILAMRGLH